MSRGLGTRQRLFLAAMAKPEAESGEDGAYVWQIVNAAGALGLTDEVNARKATREAKQAAFEEARRQTRLNAEALAASGDAAAAAELQRLQDWEKFRRSMRSLVRGPGPRMRIPKDADHIANPTRTLGLLERRGLITRRAVRGRGAGAWLTDAGRIIGFQVLEAMAQAGTPAAAQAASDTAR